MKKHKTPLRYNLMYLRCIITHAVRHHQAQTPEDSLTQATLQDYLTWLTIDALQDEALAHRITPTLARLQEELHAEANSHHIMDKDPTPQAYHEGSCTPWSRPSASHTAPTSSSTRRSAEENSTNPGNK